MTAVDTFFQWMVRTSIEGAVIVGVLLVAQWLLRNRLPARWRYALWFILIVRLLVPWTPESDFSFYNILPPFAENSAAPAGHDAMAAPWEIDLSALEIAVSPEETMDIGGDMQDADYLPLTIGDAARTWSLEGVAATLWCLGALAFAMHVVFENLRFWWRIRACPRAADVATLVVLDRCKRLMGVRTNIALIPTDEVTSPALFGFLRPRLLFPRAMLERLGPDELRYVFLHELAHLKRYDIAVNWLMTILQGIHWFNPALWFAFYRMRADRELACDALALTYTESGESQAYGRTIISLLDRVYTVRRVPGMAGILEDKSQLKRRITMIALFKKNSYRWSLLAVLLLAALGTVLLTSARAEKDAAAPALEKGLAADLQADSRDIEGEETAPLRAHAPDEFYRSRRLRLEDELAGCMARECFARALWQPESSPAQEARLKLDEKMAEIDDAVREESSATKFTAEELRSNMVRRARTKALKNLSEELGEIYARRARTEVVYQPDYPPLRELQDKAERAEQALIVAAYDQNEHLGKDVPEVDPDDPLLDIDQDAWTAAVHRLRSERTELGAKEAAMAAEYGDGHPPLQQQRDQIDQCENAMLILLKQCRDRMTVRWHMSAANLRLDTGEARATGDVFYALTVPDAQRPAFLYADTATLPKASGDEPVSEDEPREATFEGNVIAVLPEESVVFADKVTWHNDRQTVEFTGNCSLEGPKGQIFDAKAAHFTINLATGNWTAADMRAEEIKVDHRAGGDINAKVAQLDMATATVDDVIRIFGEPLSFVWGQERFQRDALPNHYCVEYANHFYVVMLGGSVEELRFHQPEPPFVFRDRIRVGSSLDDVLAVVGEPSRVVTGETGWDDGVLYRKRRGNEGECYYARGDQGVRFFFQNNKVCGLYLTNPAARNATASPSKTAASNPASSTRPVPQPQERVSREPAERSPRLTRSHASFTYVPTRAAGPVEWDGDTIMSRVLPYPDFVSLFIRLPIAHAAATGAGVKIAVVQRANDDNVRLMIRRIAPDADVLGFPVGSGPVDPADLAGRLAAKGRRIAVIPDLPEWPAEDVQRLASHLLAKGVFVVVPSDLSEDDPVIETVNALHKLGVLTAGRVDRQSRVTESYREGSLPFNTRIREIETDVFSTVGLLNTLDTNAAATAAGVAALVLERWPDLDPQDVRDKLVDGARNVWQGTSIETGQWTGAGLRVDPVTTEYDPSDMPGVFRFRVLDAAGALGVDTAVPWFLNMLNLPKAWELSRGAGTKVVVSDQGFHIKHPELRDRISGTAHFGPRTFDDAHQNFHGTDMSRILLSVAPEAKIIPVLCSGTPARMLDELPKSIAQSFRYAADQQADVVSASWSGRFRDNQDVLAAVREAVDSGVAVSWFHYPHDDAGVLRSGFAYGGGGGTPTIGFADRFLTDPPGFHPVEIEAGLSGTAPQLAGLAALARSVNPSLTPQQIKELVRQTSTPIGSDIVIPDAHQLLLAAQKD